MSSSSTLHEGVYVVCHILYETLFIDSNTLFPRKRQKHKNSKLEKLSNLYAFTRFYCCLCSSKKHLSSKITNYLCSMPSLHSQIKHCNGCIRASRNLHCNGCIRGSRNLQPPLNGDPSLLREFPVLNHKNQASQNRSLSKFFNIINQLVTYLTVPQEMILPSLCPVNCKMLISTIACEIQA